jgi:methylenetetrahydrofolate dehydrogenase (NADP+)/methenyltetrahydrofolate cyclohydrolase
MTKILDGKAVAARVLQKLKTEVESCRQKGLRAPGLSTVLVGKDPASAVYVRTKRKRADEIGIESFHHDLDDSVSEAELLALIQSLNQDPRVDGILVQLPLPKHIDTNKVLCAVSPSKDVDGFHPENVGKLTLGTPLFVPCTPKGCMYLIAESGINLLGAHAVIVGRSNIVGKPMAYLLLNTDATVTICHRNTRDLKSHTRQADILITAAGVPHLITPDHVKEGAVVIDVGINKLEDGTLVGDVDTAAVLDRVSAITPVPGGVGPMTISMLLENTVMAYKLNLGA